MTVGLSLNKALAQPRPFHLQISRKLYVGMNTSKANKKIPKIPYASGRKRRVRTRLLPSFMTAVMPYVNVDENNSPFGFILRRYPRTDPLNRVQMIALKHLFNCRLYRSCRLSANVYLECGPSGQVWFCRSIARQKCWMAVSRWNVSMNGRRAQ